MATDSDRHLLALRTDKPLVHRMENLPANLLAAYGLVEYAPFLITESDRL